MNIQELLKRRLHVDSIELRSVGGGSINETYKIITPQHTFFCKINSATKFPHLFQKEAKGLSLIRKQKIIRVPEVMDWFEEDGKQFLILEWIPSGERTESFWRKFGEQLAELHKATDTSFGLEEDNYMGSVPQQNHQSTHWNTFFIKHRLQPLIKQCRDQQLFSSTHVQQFEKVINKLPDIFNREPPSLLHGDLWRGNFMCDEASTPVLIDPAVYFGHRSVDLAMTTLFGGFHQPFYEAYHYHFPLPTNYEEQWKVCNLYPLLIHLLLFGKSYLSQIESTLNDFQ
jgi:protein-ribulosamine 3-kinase